VRVSVGKKREDAWRYLRRSRRCWGREAQRDLHPGDARRSFRRASAGKGVEAHDLQPSEMFGAFRRG